MQSQPFAIAPPRRFHPTRRRPPSPTPTPPTLVSATYAPADSVTLTFDRRVDASAMDVATLVVNDGEVENYTYEGASVEVLSATSVRVTLSPIADHADAGVWVTVSPGNGIVAVDGGAVWTGVTQFAMPFEGES